MDCVEEVRAESGELRAGSELRIDEERSTRREECLALSMRAEHFTVRRPCTPCASFSQGFERVGFFRRLGRGEDV